MVGHKGFPRAGARGGVLLFSCVDRGGARGAHWFFRLVLLPRPDNVTFCSDPNLGRDWHTPGRPGTLWRLVFLRGPLPVSSFFPPRPLFSRALYLHSARGSPGFFANPLSVTKTKLWLFHFPSETPPPNSIRPPFFPHGRFPELNG